MRQTEPIEPTEPTEPTEPKPRDGELEAYQKRIQELEAKINDQDNKIQDLIRVNTELVLKASTDDKTDDVLFSAFNKYNKK